MRALDTNIVLRLILHDDPEQYRLAAALLAQPALLVLGVLMETAWVLGSVYRLPRETVANALIALLDVPTITMADELGVRWAIARYRDHKADIADMLHIVAARGSTSFATFDRRLAQDVGPVPPVPVEHLA